MGIISDTSGRTIPNDRLVRLRVYGDLNRQWPLSELRLYHATSRFWGRSCWAVVAEVLIFATRATVRPFGYVVEFSFPAHGTSLTVFIFSSIG